MILVKVAYKRIYKNIIRGSVSGMWASILPSFQVQERFATSTVLVPSVYVSQLGPYEILTSNSNLN